MAAVEAGGDLAGKRVLVVGMGMQGMIHVMLLLKQARKTFMPRLRVRSAARGQKQSEESLLRSI